MFSFCFPESALWENIRVCSDVLEGAWYKLYEDSKQEKVKMLIRENIDNFLSNLVTESKVFITLAVFGPPGTGKSFFLNTLLSLGLDSRKMQNGPLPSAEGKSQTRLPIYIKYGRNVQVSLHKEETEPNPTLCFNEEEIEIGTFDRVRNTLESIFEEKDAKYIELQGPFPVFKQLNERKMTRSGLHLEFEVDVQFVDVPGLGDKSGDSDINVALSKADIVLFFESGKFGRDVMAKILHRSSEDVISLSSLLDQNSSTYLVIKDGHCHHQKPLMGCPKRGGKILRTHGRTLAKNVIKRVTVTDR